MLKQLLDRVVASRQLAFGKQAVDFAVADCMKNRDRPVLAAFQLRRKMVPALQMWRDFAPAKRADFQRFAHLL